jgi:metal transporter CNNM
MNGLKVLEEGGDPAEREHARLITPIREKGNLLLCVLLTGNTIVNAATRYYPSKSSLANSYL